MPEFNFEIGGASEALSEFLEAHRFRNNSGFADELCAGLELGLGIAAAIVTHGLDANAVHDAIEDELDRSAKYWPEDAKVEPPEAA